MMPPMCTLAAASARLPPSRSIPRNRSACAASRRLCSYAASSNRLISAFTNENVSVRRSATVVATPPKKSLGVVRAVAAMNRHAAELRAAKSALRSTLQARGFRSSSHPSRRAELPRAGALRQATHRPTVSQQSIGPESGCQRSCCRNARATRRHHQPLQSALEPLPGVRANGGPTTLGARTRVPRGVSPGERASSGPEIGV